MHINLVRIINCYRNLIGINLNKGLVNSGYRVRGEYDDQEWTEIGRRSPQLPQMFYPTGSDMTIKRGDYVAAACTMFNSQSHIVSIG